MLLLLPDTRPQGQASCPLASVVLITAPQGEPLGALSDSALPPPASFNILRGVYLPAVISVA